MPIGSIIGGIIGQQGAQAGGDMAWGASQQASQMSQQEAQRSRAALSPWTGAGTSALNKITKLLGMGELTQAGNNDGIYWVDPSRAEGWQQDEMNKFKTSPGYSFRQSEGIKALDRSAAAKGMTASGAQTKAVQEFGQNLASDEYNNYVNQLFNLSGSGQGATSSANNTSAALVSNAAENTARGGIARGSAYASGANALAGGISNAAQNAAMIGKYALNKWG